MAEAKKKSTPKKKVEAVKIDADGKRHYSKAERARRRKARYEMAKLLHPELE